ncbi:hypothetical protein N8I77_012439 [Diaporthe amygdali]|uniref:Rhodopsin domain-containing protein n=1 Tax=Phomopsis amygdali TaxID=1214568 RepID=A0AAD9S2T5_PHOAM|nr:hypothetical protein N8I77_012439 [Diaporthe amygdali]
MSAYKLTPAQEALDYDTRQPALWASLVAFVIINNLAIFARTWIKWVTKLNGKRITAEDIFLGKTMRVFWWVNLVYVILWWIGATGFYLFQCSPVQWYFIQYYARFGKPVPGGVKGQCKATKVLNVALPVVFSLVSDEGLCKKRKYGLLAVFGLGAIACMLELGRILDLLLDTDDKTDPSWGVAIFLILTAAIETAAVVCACLPVIGPQLIKGYKKLAGTRSDYPSYGNSSGPSADNKLVLLQNRRSESTQGGSNDDQIGLKGSFRGEDGIQLADFVARDENSYDEGDASNGPQWRSHAFVEDTRTWPVLPPPALGRVLVQADVEIESGPGSGVRLHSHLHKSNNHAFATTARF